jgi:hypothetical protein
MLPRTSLMTLPVLARFQYEKHVGNTTGAADNLRQYFDQQFTGGRQPPRQHALNAIAQHYFSSGDVESARVVSTFTKGPP